MVSVLVDEVVDPLDPDRPIPRRFDRERRRVVDKEPSLACRRHGTVAPHGRRREPCRQDLLRELPHRDLVVVDVLAAPRHDRAGRRHDRRNEQRRLELRHGSEWQRAARDVGQGHRGAAGEHRVEHEPQAAAPAAAMNARRLIGRPLRSRMSFTATSPLVVRMSGPLVVAGCRVAIGFRRSLEGPPSDRRRHDSHPPVLESRDPRRERKRIGVVDLAAAAQDALRDPSPPRSRRTSRRVRRLRTRRGGSRRVLRASSRGLCGRTLVAHRPRS